MTIPNRTFGVELEIKGLDCWQAERALNEGGVEARNEGYTHRRTHHWKIVTDASLSGRACEVVSPVMRGEEGIEEVRKVCKLLASAGARVDRQCGLHVHVGTDGLTGSDVTAIVQRYARFEDTIDSFMPPSRRGSRNHNCMSMTEWARRAERTRRAVRDIRSAISLFPERYSKINVTAYNRHRTIEFRHHSGTCNASKVENWVRFVLHFVEASRGMGPEVSAAPSRSAGGARRSNGMDAKLDRVIVALRDAGFTGLRQSDIARAGGWGVASVPPYITRLRQERGCRIRKNRRTGRYVLENRGRLSTEEQAQTSVTETRQAARRVTGVSRSQDNLFRGMPADVVSFYEERRQELRPDA